MADPITSLQSVQSTPPITLGGTNRTLKNVQGSQGTDVQDQVQFSPTGRTLAGLPKSDNTNVPFQNLGGDVVNQLSIAKQAGKRTLAQTGGATISGTATSRAATAASGAAQNTVVNNSTYGPNPSSRRTVASTGTPVTPTGTGLYNAAGRLTNGNTGGVGKGTESKTTATPTTDVFADNKKNGLTAGNGAGIPGVPPVQELAKAADKGLQLAGGLNPTGGVGAPPIPGVPQLGNTNGSGTAGNTEKQGVGPISGTAGNGNQDPFPAFHAATLPGVPRSESAASGSSKNNEVGRGFGGEGEFQAVPGSGAQLGGNRAAADIYLAGVPGLSQQGRANGGIPQNGEVNQGVGALTGVTGNGNQNQFSAFRAATLPGVPVPSSVISGNLGNNEAGGGFGGEGGFKAIPGSGSQTGGNRATAANPNFTGIPGVPQTGASQGNGVVGNGAQNGGGVSGAGAIAGIDNNGDQFAAFRIPTVPGVPPPNTLAAAGGGTTEAGGVGGVAATAVARAESRGGFAEPRQQNAGLRSGGENVAGTQVTAANNSTANGNGTANTANNPSQGNGVTATQQRQPLSFNRATALSSYARQGGFATPVNVANDASITQEVTTPAGGVVRVAMVA